MEQVWRSPVVTNHRSRARNMTIYQVNDRLHEGRTVYVRVDEIKATVSAWLAELGVDSPLAGELAEAIGAGDWAAAHGIAGYLSVEVAVAA
jgi:hypothetical protein